MSVEIVGDHVFVAVEDDPPGAAPPSPVTVCLWTEDPPPPVGSRALTYAQAYQLIVDLADVLGGQAPRLIPQRGEPRVRPAEDLASLVTRECCEIKTTLAHHTLALAELTLARK